MMVLEINVPFLSEISGCDEGNQVAGGEKNLKIG